MLISLNFNMLLIYYINRHQMVLVSVRSSVSGPYPTPPPASLRYSVGLCCSASDALLNVHPSWANTLISLFYLVFSKTSLLFHISLWRWHCPAWALPFGRQHSPNRRVIRRIKAFGHICLSLLGQTDHNHLSTVSA